MKKYTDALYPDKINDFIDNDGKLTEQAKQSGLVGPTGPQGPTGAGTDPSEIIVQVDTITPPTATADSPDLVQTRDGKCYRKIKIGG